jgi:hypothetical protein
MHTELKYKYDLSEQPPLPPAPHFDLASIAAAKRVQPLRRPRILRYSCDVLRPRGVLRQRGVLRLGTAVLAAFMMMVLGMATMARLNKQINVAPTTQETSEPADASVVALPAVETESTPMVSGDDPLVSTDRRRHRGRRHIRVLREMFEPPMFVW